MAAKQENQATSTLISSPQSMLDVDDSSQEANDFEWDSMSITASIVDYEFENGRRYHAYKAGSYPLPNDEAELERCDIHHHVITLLCGGELHFAPLRRPQRILDIGTGTGIWAMEMADQYPDAQIIGTDLSPVQPSWVPENVQFMIDDVESDEWSWTENYFDYIHSRFMICSISNWPALIGKAFKHCKPGGYFELRELDARFKSDDGTVRADSVLTYFSNKICEAAQNYNRPIPLYTEYKKWFEDAGFVDIKQTVLKAPANPWPKNPILKEASKFQLLSHLEGLEGACVALMTRGLQWKAEEVSVLMAKLRPELKNRHIHSYQHMVVLVGRKPDITESPLAQGVVPESIPRLMTPVEPFTDP